VYAVKPICIRGAQTHTQSVYFILFFSFYVVVFRSASTIPSPEARPIRPPRVPLPCLTLGLSLALALSGHTVRTFLTFHVRISLIVSPLTAGLRLPAE
jgi:hypothetical protein